jgi:hypothetical protein
VLETLLTLGAVVLLALLGWLGPHVPLEWVLYAGIVCTALGMLVGVPTGAWYHVKLYTAVRRHGALPQSWWLRPVSLHERLSPRERPEVLRWFFIGGVGFGITALGCGLVFLAVVLAALRLR